MMTPEDLFEKLAAPFPADRVSWRVGSTTSDKSKGMALAYIDARDVMDRLDAVMGPAYWQCRYPHANGKTVCEIGLALPTLTQPGQLEWVWKADGAGDTDYEAEKGALSDAFKRAAVRWGIGRYLYDLDSPWVAVEQRGKTYIIKDSEQPRLRKLLERNAPAKASSVELDKTSDRTLANTLVATLKQAQSVKDLAAWFANNKDTVEGLPEDMTDEVRSAYAARLHELRRAA
jgi:hypothetical protein